MTLIALAGLACWLCGQAAAQTPQIEVLRAAVGKSLPLLQAGAQWFRERSEGRCISCHHQGLILTTVALARSRGLAVNENLARAEIERVRGFYARRQQRYQAALEDSAALPQADPFGNFTVHAGYWLWGLAAENVAPNEALATTARLLAGRQQADGRWTFSDTARAPMQAGDITTTGVVGELDLEPAAAAPRATRVDLVERELDAFLIRVAVSFAPRTGGTEHNRAGLARAGRERNKK